MPFKNAQVEVQNDKLVVKHPESGDSALIELSTGDPHEPGDNDYETLRSIFGEGVFDHPEGFGE